MEPNQEIKDFLEDLKRFTGRDLHFARELGILMEAVRQTGMIGDFDDILFRSKFTVKTIELIKRIGPNAEGAVKLETEFKAGIQDIAVSIKKITARLPEREAEIYNNTFFTAQEGSLGTFIDLLADFTAIKNWTLDGRLLPFGDELLPSDKRKKDIEKLKEQAEGLKHIERSSILITFLFIMFLLIDPPATSVAWIFIFGILLSLSYIFMQSRLLKRNSLSIERKRK
jgi:hypothetical protein